MIKGESEPADLLDDTLGKWRECSANLHSTLSNRKQGIDSGLNFLDSIVVAVLNCFPLLVSALLALQNSRLDKDISV